MTLHELVVGPSENQPEVRPAFADVQAVFSRAALPDPYALYQRARAHGEVVPVPEWNAVAIFGHDEVSAVLRSPAALSGQQLGQALKGGQVSEAMQLLAPMMLFHNGASHARLRSLVNAAFTPRVVAEQEDLVRGLVQDILKAEQGGNFDLVDKLAVPLPVAVISRMLGLSHADEQQFRLWTQSIAELLGGLDSTLDLMARIEEDARQMRLYFRDLADNLRTHPQAGLLSALAAAEDQEGRLSSDELLANAVLLLAAGHETTSNLIGRGVLALHQQTGAWDELVALPEIGNLQADELLRFTSPVQLTGRALAAPLDIGGQTYEAGTHTMLLLAAANRDERTFMNADRIDLTRSNASKHLAFASGPHYCLGASLARLETRVVFGELARYPQMRVLEQTHYYRPNIVLRGLSTLMVNLG